MYHLANITEDRLPDTSNFENFVTYSDSNSIRKAVESSLEALGITEPGRHTVFVMWGIYRADLSSLFGGRPDPNPGVFEKPNPQFRIVFVTVPEPVEQPKPEIDSSRPGPNNAAAEIRNIVANNASSEITNILADKRRETFKLIDPFQTRF